VLADLIDNKKRTPPTMATIHIDHDAVVITPTRFERIAGLVGVQRIPLSSILDVTIEEDPHGAISGFRAPGLAIPGSTKIGTWRDGGRRVFVCVRDSKPAVRIETVGRDDAGGQYDGFIVTHDDPHTIADEINAARPTRS
jgi:hypothetical protein